MTAIHPSSHPSELDKCNALLRKRIRYGNHSGVEIPASIYSRAKEYWTRVLRRYLSKYLTGSNKDDIRIKLAQVMEGLAPSIISDFALTSITLGSVCDPPIFSLLYSLCKNDLLALLRTKASATIVIPTYNRDAQLESCIRHLASLQLGFLKIAVVDNNSIDNTCQVVKRAQADYGSLVISYQKNSANIGWLRNYFVALATNIDDIVILGSDDDLLSEEMLVYASFFSIANPQFGIISFSKSQRRPELPLRNSFVLAMPASSSALEILKNINAVGGVTLSRDAIIKCLNGFGTDLNLVSHIEFCLNIALEFPIASFFWDDFCPRINALSQIRNSTGASTSPHDVQYLVEMMQSNILDHKFCIDSFNRTATGYMLYAASSKISEGSSALPSLSGLFFDFNSRWMNAWLGHRMRDFSRLASIEDIRMMILRLTDHRYIYNIDVILHVSFAIDIRIRELDPSIRSLYSLLVLSVIKAKALFLNSQGCPSMLGLALPEIGGMLKRTAKKIANNKLTLYQGINLFQESIKSYHYLALNTHAQDWHFYRSFHLRATTIKDRLSEGFTLTLSDLFSSFSAQSLAELELLIEESVPQLALRFRKALNEVDLLCLIDKTIDEIKHAIHELDGADI